MASLLDILVERYETTGARGALKGARVALLGESLDEAYEGFNPEKTFEPNARTKSRMAEAYERHITACELKGLIKE